MPSTFFGAQREGYTLLFPVGAAFALIGTAVWPLALLPTLPYPGPLHSALMLEGFELSFVSGFLLTILPRLTRTEPAGREALVALGLLLGFGVAALAGRLAIAHGFALADLLLLATVLVRRVRARRNDPPEEALFIPAGLLFGIAGSFVALLAQAGVLVEPAPRLGLRLISLGMVLALVLGFGTLLVPVFLEIRDPLVIPRIARPHERAGRRVLYLAAVSGLAFTFVLDALKAHVPAAYGRAIVATMMLGFGWKLWRVPGRRTVPAMVLWSSGAFVGAGLWLAAAFPLHEIAALHVTMLGGYGVLTMGIASRVVVTHGGHGPDAERRLVTPSRAALLLLALLARVGAEAQPAHGPWWLAVAALAWIAAWAGWLFDATRPRAQP